MKISDLRLSLYLFKKTGALKRKIEGFISIELMKKLIYHNFNSLFEI